MEISKSRMVKCKLLLLVLKHKHLHKQHANTKLVEKPRVMLKISLYRLQPAVTTV